MIFHIFKYFCQNSLKLFLIFMYISNKLIISPALISMFIVFFKKCLVSRSIAEILYIKMCLVFKSHKQISVQ